MQNQKIRVEVEDLSPVKKKLNISIPREDVDRELSAAYRELRSHAAVAGFRKGVVPLNVLKVRFGEKVKEDVVARLIDSSYTHAIAEKKIIPAEKPKVDLSGGMVEEGHEFTYSVTLEVTPQVEMDGYMGMEIKREKIEVADKEVEDALEHMRETHMKLKPVDRAAKSGDIITVDFEGFLNGVPIRGYKAADYHIPLGESEPLPGFESGITGASKGEKKEIKVRFPESFSDESLANKEAVFAVNVKAVRERIIPELDDEFAKDMHCDNLEKLKEKVKEETRKAKEKDEKENAKNAILDKLIEKHPFEVPESLVNRYLAAILSNVVANMKAGIVAQEDQGLTPDELKAKYRQEAIRRVREDIILDSIVAREKVEVTEEEVKSAIKFLADSRGISYDTLMSRIQKDGTLEIIRDGLKHDKVFEMILASLKPAA